MTIKEQLKGTCVLNEKEGMGAEIVALYTEAGIENDEALVGDCIGEYYGERDGIIDNQVSKEYFQTILTLSQLREIVRGEKAPENFNNKCLIEAFSEVPDLSQPVEFKEGEMVEVYLEGTWCERKYAFFVSGEHWYYNLSIEDTVHIADDIRKIDPDKEIKQYAKEIMKRYIERDDKRMELMLIEAMKKVQSKK